MGQESALCLYLLGPFKVEIPGKESPAIGRKTRAMLAYLGAQNQTYSRRALSDLFCQEARDPAGALRWHLSRMRQAFGEHTLIEGESGLSLNPAEVAIDCLEFEAALAGPRDSSSLETVETALRKYRGEFLEGLHLPDSPEFELWLLGRRAYYADQFSRTVQSLLDRLIQTGAFEEAIEWAQRLVSHDPLLEEGHQRLIWLYGRTGQRQAALRQFEICKDLLAQELAVEPISQLQALYDRILGGELGADLQPQSPEPSAPGVKRGDAPFAGRAFELEILEQAYRSARAGQASVVLVEAEAGGGKTRLVEEFVSRQITAFYLTGRGFESMRAFSYRPWIDILETFLDQIPSETLATFPSFWLDQLNILLPGISGRLNRETAERSSTGSAQGEPLFTVVSEILLRLSRDRPLILFLDDLQWMDKASFQLLHFVARRLRRPRTQPTLLVCAYRGEEVAQYAELDTLIQDLQRSPHTHIVLPPLDNEAIDEIVARLWPSLAAGFRPHVVKKLAHTAGGNPFFVTEVVQALNTSETVPDNLPVPSSVQALIQRRLRQLDESSRQVVEAMAVLGLPATVEEAQSTSARSEEETHLAIDLALQRELLVAKPTARRPEYDFQHELVREAVIEQLSDVRRRLLHARAARALEAAGEPAARLAYHWSSAGNLPKEAHFTLEAGEAAAHRFAHEEARRFIRRFLELGGSRQERARALLTLGQIDHLIGNWDKAQAHYQDALALAEDRDDADMQAKCLTQIGLLGMHRGLYERAREDLLKAEQLFEQSGDRAGMANAVGTRAIVLWYLGDYDEALRLLELRREIAESVGDPYGASIAVANMGIVYWSQGDLEKAAACYEQKLTFDRTSEDRLSLSKGALNIGLVYRDLGDYSRALESYAEKLRVDKEEGDQLGVCFALENIGDIYTRAGKLIQAQACLLECLGLAVELGSLQVVSIALGRIAELALEQQDAPLALKLTIQAAAIARQIKLPRNLCLYLLTQARALMKLERFEEAGRMAEEASAVAQSVKRDQVIFQSGVLQERIKATMGPAGSRGAVRALHNMLALWPDDSQQADLHFEIWRLNPEQKDSQKIAANLYLKLYGDTPAARYRRRFEALKGKRPPPPEPLPAIVETEGFEPADLDHLLEKVESLTAALIG